MHRSTFRAAARWRCGPAGACLPSGGGRVTAGKPACGGPGTRRPLDSFVPPFPAPPPPPPPPCQDHIVGGTLMTMRDRFFTQAEYSRLIYECVAQVRRRGRRPIIPPGRGVLYATHTQWRAMAAPLDAAAPLPPAPPNAWIPAGLLRRVGHLDGPARGPEASEAVDGQAGACGRGGWAAATQGAVGASAAGRWAAA